MRAILGEMPDRLRREYLGQDEDRLCVKAPPHPVIVPVLGGARKQSFTLGGHRLSSLFRKENPANPSLNNRESPLRSSWQKYSGGPGAEPPAFPAMGGIR